MRAPARTREPVAGGLWCGLGEIPAGWGPCVATLGVFDGVHRGHVRLISSAVDLGRVHGLPTVLVTFDPHPARVTGPPRSTATLSTPARRGDLAQDLGVDAVLVLPFTPQLAGMTAEEFVRHVLVEGLRVSAVVVGRNFRFGRRGAGTVDMLRLLARRWGFAAQVVDLLQTAEERCSSPYVRSCLSRGDVAAAATALGRPHLVEGRLVASSPLVSLEVPSDTAVPAVGCYAGRLRVEGGRPVHVEVVVRDGSVTLSGRGLAALDGCPVSLDFLSVRERS